MLCYIELEISVKKCFVEHKTGIITTMDMNDAETCT